MLMPELLWYQYEGIHSSTVMLWFQTEIKDAGMPMLASSALMLMPSYADDIPSDYNR
jgi:hypothetical protein